MRIAPAVAAAAALLAAAAPVRADVLRMENGKVMHGTVDRSFVDPDCLRIQLFSTGGTVRVRWSHLITEDRDRWQEDMGLKETSESQALQVDAHKFWVENRTQPLFGLILNPEDLDKGPNAEIRVLVKGSVDPYPRGRIVNFEPVRLDLALVFTPKQAYERKRDEINPVTGDSHFDLAEYARLVGAYDEAKEHYGKAKDSPGFADTPRGKTLESRLATLETLIRNRSLQQEMDRVKVLLLEARNQSAFARGAEFYLQARDIMFRLMTEQKDKKVQAELKMEDLANRVEAERRNFFQKRLFGEVRRRVSTMAYEKAREQKVQNIPPGTDRAKEAELRAQGTFDGARQFIRRKAKEDLWNGILRDSGASKTLEELKVLMEKDPAKLTDADKARATRLAQMEKSLRAEIVEDYWPNRAKGGFVVTTYGHGTFIITGNQLKLQRKPPSKQPGGAKKGPSQKAVDVIKTPEKWWEEAGAQERVNWLMTEFAEKAGVFEVLRTWDDPCSDCAGLGYKKTSVASTGEEEVERCVTCNGAKVERKVRWR
jgi:hypothetical protein